MEGNGYSNPYGAQGKKTSYGNAGGLISSRNLGGVSQDSQSVGNSKSHNTANPAHAQSNGQVMMKRTTRRYQSTDKYAPPSISSLAGPGNGLNTQRAQIVTNANQMAAAAIQQEYMKKGAGDMALNPGDLTSTVAAANAQNRQKSGDYRHSQMKEQGGPRSEKKSEDVVMRKTLSIAEDPTKVIKFGQTKFSDYTKVCVLGKGTYGEVTRCIHIASGLEVAMKTFFFEVINISLNFSLECI